MDEPKAHIIFGTEAVFERADYDADLDWMNDGIEKNPRLFWSSEHEGYDGDCVVGIELFWAGWDCFSDLPDASFVDSPTRMAADIERYCKRHGVVTKNHMRFMLIATMQ